MKLVYGTLISLLISTSAFAQNVIQQDTFFGDNIVQQQQTIINRPARTVRKVTKVVRKNVYNTYNTYVEEKVVAAPAPPTQIIIEQAPPQVVIVRPQPSVTTVYNPSPYYPQSAY
jgi:hypothetical protein